MFRKVAHCHSLFVSQRIRMFSRASAGVAASAAVIAPSCSLAHCSSSSPSSNAVVTAVRYASCGGGCGMSGFTDVKYNDAAERWLDDACDTMDGLCEDFPVINDVSNSGGVLTIDLGDEKGTFILNKQAPKRQLWLSSPISGPSHYDMITDEASGRVWWKCDKTGADLSRLLEKEFKSLLPDAAIELP